MEYLSENLKRMAQVLKAINISYEYVQNKSIFLLKELKIVMYDETITTHTYELSKVFNTYNTFDFINIKESGILEYKDGSAAIIKMCSNCKKFYFGKSIENKRKTPCSFCGNLNSKMLTNNGKVPGWYGTKTKYIISEADAQKVADDDEIEDRVKDVIIKLIGTPKIIKATPKKMNQIKLLMCKYPNMIEPINYICQTLEVAMASKNHNIRFKPFVLVGGPACGKTSFTTDLCSILLEKKALKIDLGNCVANFTLTGSDPAYNHSKEGLIIKSMFKDDDGHPLWNPIIHFDELDKINNKENYTIETVFYSILERNTAKNFFDNFISMNVDASGVNYIFTANCLEKIPPAILSRLKIFKIPDYTYAQLLGNLDYFYLNWIENNDMDPGYLPAKLSTFISNEILKISGTDTRRIEDAINTVFEGTRKFDEKSNHTIALFSPEEIYNGWEKFRGFRKFSEEEWKLPKNFS